MAISVRDVIAAVREWRQTPADLSDYVIAGYRMIHHYGVESTGFGPFFAR